MKTVFVVNPKAGQGKGVEKLISSIKTVTEENGFDTEIYITKAIGDAEAFVREYCNINGPARFIACGGDGTLCEVVNGMIDCDGAEAGVIPMGTGNDFCRNFTDCDFKSIKAQITSEAERCDIIRYTTVLDGKTLVRYGVNMFNIGFDCNVADMTIDMKKKPFVAGPMAYYLSIFATLIKKKGANLKIELDGETVHHGPLLLCALANGVFCGGGIKSNPKASLHDGKIDINIIHNINRMKILNVLPHYMKGTHMEKIKNVEQIITSTKCKKMAITPADSKMRICVDGEITDASKTEFEVVNSGFSFVVPSKKESKILA